MSGQARQEKDFSTILSRARENLLTKIEMADHWGCDKGGIAKDLIKKLSDYLPAKEGSRVDEIFSKDIDENTARQQIGRLAEYLPFAEKRLVKQAFFRKPTQNQDA